MNQVKWFLIGMFAVGVMQQVHADQQQRELRNELIGVIEQFQAYELEDTSIYKMILSCCSCDRIDQKDKTPLNDRFDKIRVKLCSDMPIHELREYAKTIKWMCPNPYEGREEFQGIVTVCTKIIAFKQAETSCGGDEPIDKKNQ